MKSFHLKGVVLCYLALIFSLSFPKNALAGPGDGHGIQKEVDGVTVVLVFKAEPLKTGSSGILIRFEEGHHEPVFPAEVHVSLVSMNDHSEEKSEDAGEDKHAGNQKDNHSKEAGGHADDPMVFNMKTGHNPGEYEGTLSFPEAGEWEVTVSFLLDGTEKEVSFIVEVLPGGGPWIIVGGFFGVNTAIILTAGVMRSKRTKSELENS